MIPLRERSIPKNKCGFARMLQVRLICQNQGQKDKQMIFCDFVGQFKIMFKVVKKNCHFPVKKEVRMFQFFIIGSVSNICSNASNFPTKNLENSINHTCFTLQIILFVLKCIVLSKLFN